MEVERRRRTPTSRAAGGCSEKRVFQHSRMARGKVRLRACEFVSCSRFAVEWHAHCGGFILGGLGWCVSDECYPNPGPNAASGSRLVSATPRARARLKSVLGQQQRRQTTPSRQASHSV